MLCGCLNLCQTKYKRTVDNVFPRHAKEGIVKSNLEKLCFYAESKPEKLDRIGEYLAAKVSRDMPKPYRTGFVLVAVDAMDALLLAAYNVQSLNLFIEAYLKVVQLLLESPQPEMQLLATKSFIKFANIDEDTPSYHRRYDFFVSKFSALCHSSHENCETRTALRLAGLNGLKGVIRKTVSDDLQVDIWDKDHMGKIIPSLLYNMEDKSINPLYDQSDSELVRPSAMAEDNLRLLLGKASFGNIRAVLCPVLNHLDYHGHWDTEGDEPNKFAMHIFHVTLEAIQAQHVYAVIQILMTHLDTKELKGHPKFQDHEALTKVRTGIAQVISQIVVIAAAESIGPTVLEIINSLLNHLRCSINYSVKLNAINAERRFQDTVINALGEFANNLPDFQKIEIMMFIISKVPPTSTAEADVQMQAILLKSLLKVATTYKTVNLTQAFPRSFLKPLLVLSSAPDPSVRLTVQKILHQLLDRHQNLVKLCRPQTLATLPPLAVEKAYRQDIIFWNKNGRDIIQQMFESFKHYNNNGDNYEALYTTLALLSVEMSSDDVLIEILRVSLCLQDLAINKETIISEQQKSAFHSISISLANLAAHLLAVPPLGEHIQAVIQARHEQASWMLPESNRYAIPARRRPSVAPVQDTPDPLRLDRAVIDEALRTHGHDTAALFLPFVSSTVTDATDGSNGPAGMTRSSTDLHPISLEVDSVTSSPGADRRPAEEAVSFAIIKKVLTSAQPDPESVHLRRAQLIETFRTQTFSELQRSRTDRQNPCFDVRTTVDQAYARCMANVTPKTTPTHRPKKPKVAAPSEGPHFKLVTLRVSEPGNTFQLTERNGDSDGIGDDDSDSEDERTLFESISLINHDQQRLPLFAMRFPTFFSFFSLAPKRSIK